MNTQKDFLSVDGILPVIDRSRVSENIKKIFEWIKRHRIPVISPVDSHRPGEGVPFRSPLFNCIEGTLGQQKIGFSLLPKRLTIEHDNSPSLADNLLENYLQIVITKRTNDVFTNPKADRLFSYLQAKRFLIFGVGIERAVKSLVLGLLSRGKNPIVVSDACGTWDTEIAELTLRQLEAKGAIILKTSELTPSKPDHLPIPQVEIHADVE
jgi:nicotinamidase-related amidase